MTKQEKIEKVYINELSKNKKTIEDGLLFYNDLKQYIDENGWINANESNGKAGYLMESDLEFNFPFIRLKSLQGIENNNGWIKIESKADLPKEDDNKMFLVGFMFESGFQQRHGILSYDGLVSVYLFEKFTHYLPIDKNEPPIY